MKKPKPVVIDFETKKIEGRPVYPPEPVGVAIKLPGKKSRYYAWGHPSKNNCTKAEAVKALKGVWPEDDAPGMSLLFQNGKFDVDVAEVHLGLQLPKWHQIHDTMFLLFLDDPHQQELSLKPAAVRLLGWAAEEQEAVMTWLLKEQPVEGVKLSKAKGSDNYWAAYISYAPGDLVGTYACGDVDRTEAIFDLLWPRTQEREMLEAYDRERRLMPILLEAERQGVPVDLKRLRADVKLYNTWRDKINLWIIKALRASPDINLDSGDQLVQAMIKCGKADPDKMPRTATGKISTAKDSLLLGVTDKQLLAVLKYRTQLNTCLNTFLAPWLRTAEASRGLIFTNWNQTRQPSGDHNVGTRTGRLSSTPNFQNIPNEFKPIFAHEQKGLPKCPFKDLPPLPMCRAYITAHKGHVLMDRDYSQQEPRILGHFEGGALLQAYLRNPWIDFHDSARDELAKAGRHYDRKPVKNTNLGLIYGMGVGLLAEKNGMSVEESKELKDAILALYPGLKEMYRDMKARARAKEPIRTWGGREYYCEEPRIIDGRLRQFDYKLVNVLIQGSAADCMKEALIRYHAKKHSDARILLNVHDQITVSVPKKLLAKEMEVLRQCMESVEFDVPILSEGSTGFYWNGLKDYDKKGKRI
jgi:DNA polymerase I-like protein with 3'-5' exonuclease and polymerase domains